MAARPGWETEAERRRVPPCRSVRLGPAWPGLAGRKSRGCAIRPGCGSGRALFGFGAGTLGPHPSLGLPGWLTHPTGVCSRPGAGRGWDFPPFCRLARSGLPLSRGRWGDGWQRRAVRLAGELVFPFSVGSPLSWRRGRGAPEWSAALARELVCLPPGHGAGGVAVPLPTSRSLLHSLPLVTEPRARTR